MQKIILAYSGGLDTSVILRWLLENRDCEVIAVAVDVGLGEEDLAGLAEKALKTGAAECFVIDVREEFVRDYLYPLIKAGAVYEGQYFLGTAIARPLIARKLVEVAQNTQANAIAHGATGKGNDQVRFELGIKALAPDLEIIAPWREWDIQSRKDALDYAKKHGISVSATLEKPYSIDRNFWHISYEGGILEDPINAPPLSIFQGTKSPFEAPDEPEEITIDWEQGIPIALNGREMDPVELLEALNEIGGKHGIGRVDLVENRLVGIKSRGIYETPGGALLFFAHRELEHLCLDRETLHYKEQISLKYAELTYNGLWFTPLRKALDAFIDHTQKPVCGQVKMQLYKGNIITLSRESSYSLYHTELATFDEDGLFNQRDATGFINLFGLPLKVQGWLDKEKNKRKEEVIWESYGEEGLKTLQAKK